jgi:predicted outer membrane repeat protein
MAGGAIDNSALARISGATFLSNTSATRGGAIENFGTLVISLSTLQGNIAQGPGGAIYNQGTLSIAQDTLANNTTLGFYLGGGLADFGTFADINSSTFVNNAAGAGGGMVLSDTQVYLEDSTFSANSALGGAGAFVETGTVRVDNVTFYANTAVAGSALDVSGGPVFVQNSILASSPSASCAGVVTSLGNNIDNGNSCLLAASGDMTNTNPLLGPLADNGGPTFTHALLPGSPAIHHGNRPYCQGLDQRGYVRGPFCDIGAFQVVFRVLAPLVRR